MTMYRRYIDSNHSFHKNTYRAMEARLEKPGPAAPFTLPATAVAEKVIHALESRKPKCRYPVTVPTYLFACLKRLLPTVWLDRILAGVD